MTTKIAGRHRKATPWGWLKCKLGFHKLLRMSGGGAGLNTWRRCQRCGEPES